MMISLFFRKNSIMNILTEKKYYLIVQSYGGQRNKKTYKIKKQYQKKIMQWEKRGESRNGNIIENDNSEKDASKW